MKISFDLKNIGSKDLSIQIFEIQLDQKADSYYYTLDNFFMAGVEDGHKTILNLIRLLEKWAKAIISLETGESEILPFDFSDQYIGCLRINSLPDDKLLIDYGYSVEYTGSGLAPSQFDEIKLSLNHYEATTSSYNTNKEIFIEDLTKSIYEIREIEQSLS